MNLFFRRLWVYLRAYFSSKQEPFTDVYTLSFRVWLTDQDTFLHLTNSRYLSFSDLARLNLLIRTGVWDILKREEWNLVVCGQTRTIARMLKSPQTFDLACQIQGWTDKYLAISHVFERGEKKHAEVNTLMQIETRDGAPVSPTDLLNALGVTDLPPDPTDVFLELIDRAESVHTGNEQS